MRKHSIPKALVKLYVMIVIFFTLLIWTIWGNTALTVGNIKISSSRIPPAFSGFRIAQVSDLHNAEFGKGNKKLLELLSESKPDIIVITGDFVDAGHTDILSFMQSDSVYQKYRDEVIILLGTGLRISELCGLTETDLDFENRVINVDHQLLRSAETGYYIEKPKTQSGIRQIPMSEKVYEALGRVLENRKGAKQITIDGYSNFLFLNRDGCPKTGVNYSNMFRGLVKKYNKCHEEALPKIMTPHTLRHTFCTNLANAGMNPKALQYIMGHSNIAMTLNYYAHATFASARAEMERLIAA